MKFFRYTARDRSGLVLQGTVQAASLADVQRDLASKGYQLQQIEELGANKSVPANAPGSLPQVNIHVPAPRPSPSVIHSAPPIAGSVAASKALAASAALPPTDIVHTKQGTDKQRFFLFSQLAGAFRAGLNASQAFSEVSQRSAEQFAPSLQYASAATAQGSPISEVFAKYPDLYPASVVGVTRAGEAAGFLPDAFEEIARQAESAHAFRRWFFWVWFLFVNFALSLPLMKVTVSSISGLWKDLNANGGATGGSNGTQLFLGEMVHSMLWPWGPITLIAYAACWAFNRWLANRNSESFRHRLGLKIPVYGKRAVQENLARFSWTMSRVSRAGISPARAWQLSADSVPNREFRDELVGIGAQLRGSEKMSDLFFRSKLFPEEYAPMIASAEYTGDLSGALDKLSMISAGEFVAAQNYAKARSGCWGFLAVFITSAILVGMLLHTVDVEIPTQIMQDTDEGK